VLLSFSFSLGGMLVEDSLPPFALLGDKLLLVHLLVMSQLGLLRSLDFLALDQVLQGFGRLQVQVFRLLFAG